MTKDGIITKGLWAGIMNYDTRRHQDMGTKGRKNVKKPKQKKEKKEKKK